MKDMKDRIETTIKGRKIEDAGNGSHGYMNLSEIHNSLKDGESLIRKYDDSWNFPGAVEVFKRIDDQTMVKGQKIDNGFIKWGQEMKKEVFGK